MIEWKDRVQLIVNNFIMCLYVFVHKSTFKMKDWLNPSYVFGSHKNIAIETVNIENDGYFYHF